MIPIVIVTGDGILLAHHTTEHPLSCYKTLIWSVEKTPEQGTEILWTRGGDSHMLTVVGLVGGWLVVRQANGVLAAILWIDGSYRAGLIVDRETGEPAPADTDLTSGKCTVRGAAPFLDSAPGALLL
jgi:hypothetical protein